MPANTPVELFEWVSMDSRALPHALYIVVSTRSAQMRYIINKASERVAQADVLALARRSSPGLEYGGVVEALSTTP